MQTVHSDSVEPNRIQVLNKKDFRKGRCVLYWMQQSQRAEENPALTYAIELANYLDQPLLVVFGLTAAYPEANLRHYNFMLEGLHETQTALADRGIKMAVQTGHPPDVALRAGAKASALVCDRGYLRHQKAWRRRVADKALCRVVQVEGDVVVPLEVVSDKAEYAARTIRPKIHRHLDDYLKAFDDVSPAKSSAGIDFQGLDPGKRDPLLKKLDVDRSVPPVPRFLKGGTTEAKARFARFLKEKLRLYDRHHNQPQTDDVSHMSPYLHFGQISPVYLALQVKQANPGAVGKENCESFLEELVVRRELAANFVNYTPDYDAYSCVPAWAQKTLAEHAADKRDPLYSAAQLEAAETHDEYWNAAMLEMKHTGFMHNYMRMYWGKKILEWCRSPESAYATTLALNNKYFIDGRDANSYAGVAWTYGVHDRAWAERPIFGKVRYMAASGLERKCDIQGYVQKVRQRISAPVGGPNQPTENQ
jgi:deoxyribodipyrimidine photo-lyase